MVGERCYVHYFSRSAPSNEFRLQAAGHVGAEHMQIAMSYHDNQPWRTAVQHGIQASYELAHPCNKTLALLDVSKHTAIKYDPYGFGGFQEFQSIGSSRINKCLRPLPWDVGKRKIDASPIRTPDKPEVKETRAMIVRQFGVHRHLFWRDSIVPIASPARNLLKSR
jgi:hypothetical protein